MLTYRSSDAPTGLEDASITAPREMADPGAAVVLDVDSQRVRAVMIDSVEGESRFIASVEVMSTLGMPVDDLSVGVREALALLAGQTGVRIDNEADDVDAPDTITMTGFPAPPLNVAIVPAGTNPLTAVLTLTSWATPSFVHLLTDAVRTEDGLLSATLLEIRLRGLQPDIVVMLEGDRAQSEWASAAGAFGSLMSDGVIDQLIVLAADEFQQYLIQALGEDANMTGLDPSQYEAHEVAMALETELEDLYEQRVASSLRLNVGRPVKFVSRLRSGDLATRYIARRLERSVVSLDISSGTSICWSNAHSGGSIARPDLGCTPRRTGR